MPESQATEAEPRVQPKFSFAVVVSGLVLFAAIVGADLLFDALPDRRPASPEVGEIQIEPIEISAAGLAPLVLVGAWEVTSPQPRVGGISGVAVDGEELVAITDAGAVLRFPKRLEPRMPVRIADLPAGPGDPRFKKNRDSEAILRDPATRGWWVAFENRDALWLFDRGFTRALREVAVPSRGLSENSGIEGLAGGDSVIFAFPENGRFALRSSGGRWGKVRLDRGAPVSDTVRIGESILLLHRRLTVRGFENALALVRPDGSTFRTLWRKRLPVSWRDNFEAVAAEPIAGGGHRLWMMSDDNFHPRMRTVLLVVDVPAAMLPKAP